MIGQQFVGAAIFLGGLLSFFLASSPMVEALVGGVLWQSIESAAANAFWIIPLGAYIALFMPAPPVMYPLTVGFIISTVALYLIINVGVFG